MFVITFCFVYITYGKQSNLAIKFIIYGNQKEK